MPDWRTAAWLAGALCLAGLAVGQGSSHDLVVRPVAQTPKGPRIHLTAPRLLEDGAPQVESILNAPARMRYGDFVWNDANVPAGPIWVRVDRRTQIISVFRGAHEIGTAVILYGAPEKPTPSGAYPILQKLRTHVSATYGADMPYTLRLTADGISVHASDVREGYATHGCIGVPEEFARRLFDEARVGDRITIV